MEPLIWLLLPVFVAAGSALLSFYIMQARMEVAVAREREVLAAARATIDSQEKILVEKVKATEESARRDSLNEFLGDFRVEERHYARESKSLFASKKSMVLQERLYFRNIPLSNWVEHELTVEENGDLGQLAKACSIFSAKPLAEPASAGNGSRFLT
ncbi:MAG TPA: hypothetical protein VM120_26515 [Bryobacteraceae bacterium]|nr:hypothetical protein [Bryobacteraceae bacterium]